MTPKKDDTPPRTVNSFREEKKSVQAEKAERAGEPTPAETQVAEGYGSKQSAKAEAAAEKLADANAVIADVHEEQKRDQQLLEQEPRDQGAAHKPLPPTESEVPPNHPRRRLTEELLAKMGQAEIRAVAKDRGYDLTKQSFLEAQSKDQGTLLD